MQQKYSTWKDLVADPAVDAVYGEFLEYAKSEGIKASDEDVAKSTPDIKLAMKALMARAVWNESTYYRVINSEDDDYRAALEEVLALKAR